MGSNPGRKLSLLSFAHPVKGPPFQVHGAIGKVARTRDRVLEEIRVVALVLLCKPLVSIYNLLVLKDGLER